MRVVWVVGTKGALFADPSRVWGVVGRGRKGAMAVAVEGIVWERQYSSSNNKSSNNSSSMSASSGCRRSSMSKEEIHVLMVT